MKLRSNCKCECHNNNHLAPHEQPCCIENPSFEQDWISLKTKLIEEGLPENTTEFFKNMFYLGAYRMMTYITLYLALEPTDANQMFEDLHEDIDKCVHTMMNEV